MFTFLEELDSNQLMIIPTNAARLPHAYIFI